MTAVFRNDHDATLARVDALRLEVRRLDVENAKLREGAPVIVPAKSRVPVLVTAVVLGIGAAVGGFFLTTGDADAESRVAAIDTDVGRAEVTACIATIGPPPGVMGRVWVAPSDMPAIRASEAPCRLALDEIMASRLWSPAERGALKNWRDAEDRLANSIQMLEVGSAQLPLYANVAESDQVWREYSSALVLRDLAIARWRAL